MIMSEDSVVNLFTARRIRLLAALLFMSFLIYLNSATHIVRNKFKILSNNILPSILPCQKIHLT